MLSLRLLLVLAPFTFKGVRGSPIADASPVPDPPWGVGPNPAWGCKFMNSCVKLWDDIDCHPRSGHLPSITFTPNCPDMDAFCYSFPWLDVVQGGVGNKTGNWISLTTKGGTSDSTNCRVYSDYHCKELIIETHNHWEENCFQSPGGRSIQCWEGCGKIGAKRSETLDSEATPDHEEILTADDEETLTLVGSHNPKSS